MSASPPPPLSISLKDVAERRVWCPFSGNREEASGAVFAANSCCIGPRCAGWTWRGASDARESERRRCHLLPPHFSPGYRVRLAGQLMPGLVSFLRVLAGGNGEPDAARAAILDWARDNWRPEQDLPVPEIWKRPGVVFWDSEADTVALDLVRRLTDDQRAGVCGLKEASRPPASSTES